VIGFQVVGFNPATAPDPGITSLTFVFLNFL